MTKTEQLANLRAASLGGAIILANEGRHGRPLNYHVVNAEGVEPQFTCEPHEYLVVWPSDAVVDLAGASNRAIPFLRDEAAKYKDDGNNEPLETARDIEGALRALRGAE